MSAAGHGWTSVTLRGDLLPPPSEGPGGLAVSPQRSLPRAHPGTLSYVPAR